MYASGIEVNWIRRPRPCRQWPSLGRRTLLWLAFSLALVFGLATAAHGSAPTSYDRVTVGVGDTVWSLAAERYPGADTRAKVDEIMRANGLKSPELHPGEVLRLPAE